MKSVLITITVVAYLIGSLFLQAADSNMEFSDTYKKVDDPQRFITEEFAKARAENKNLIFVLGGNWCHDSRSLAKKLQHASLERIIMQNYRISMVDVGYLNQGFEFAEKAKMRTFYATPTVLIFDPISEQLINADDMHIWSRADKISQSEANAYFKGHIKTSDHKKMTVVTKAQELYLEKLQQFVSIQELRIKSSYQVIGPLLERYKVGIKDKQFEPYWEALAVIRNSLPKDSKKLRTQILAAADIQLESIRFPQYAALPWE